MKEVSKSKRFFRTLFFFMILGIFITINNVLRLSPKTATTGSSLVLQSIPSSRLPTERRIPLTKEEEVVTTNNEMLLPSTTGSQVSPPSRASCIRKGMQEKCKFDNLIFQKNEFYVTGEKILQDRYPNPIFPADGQEEPLRRYHNYRGHKIFSLKTSPMCDAVVTTPAIFVYRMSGHSTYHLWENNLGPFFATLRESFNDEVNLKDFRDPSKLVIIFVDKKPSSGPKAPHLLDQLFRTFTNAPIFNGSAIVRRTCFRRAVIGTSASSFNHRMLVTHILQAITGSGHSAPRKHLSIVYISRNHPSVIRGRKVANEAEMIAALNGTVIKETGGSSYLKKVHMEEMTYRDQVLLATGTDVFFSPHGGGVANCIWMNPGSIMVEFVAPVGKTLPGMYHTMCKNSGVIHFHFLAEPDPQDAFADLKGNARLFSNMIVPPTVIAQNALKALRMIQQSQ